MKYNEQQEKIIKSNEKHILVLASAGSGKTSTLIARVNYLLNEALIAPQSILVLTFSNKASKELHSRLKNPSVTVSTFHKFALDNIKSESLLLDQQVNNFTKEEIKNISLYKNSYSHHKPLIFDKYDKFLKTNNLIDFDDMLNILYEKLSKKQVNFSFSHIFIDEFQDTNNISYEILKLINKEAFIFAVGDPDQAIYAFRGANLKIIDQFIKEYHPTMYFLTFNYRSYQKIIILANEVIKKNVFRIKKDLVGTKTNEGLLNISSFKSEEFLVDYVINTLYENKNSKYCILYRINKSSFLLRSKLEHLYSLTNYTLMSIHQSKGLEFDNVIILDANDINIPGDSLNLVTLEEERRIFFVAITRSRKSLLILSNEQKGPVTRFIKNIKKV
jgi:DNA helicase-2/ATP-dependent DNA helicase PcrA